MTIEERQEAAKWFQNRASHTTMQGAKMMFERAAEALSEGIQPHWIPCSERLPDEFGEYLVTKKAIGWNCEEYNSNDIAYFYNEGFHKADKVLAWMPLPEPYGGESE